MSNENDPAWIANPLLSEVREALKEIQHIHGALKQLEAAATISVASYNNAQFEGALHRTRLREWLASLNETYLAMAFLVADPMSIRGPEYEAIEYLKSELEKANYRWGGAIKRARQLLIEQRHTAQVKAIHDKAAADGVAPGKAHDAWVKVHDAKVKAIMDRANARARDQGSRFPNNIR